MVAFIDEHRNKWGVEPICDVLPIAPSTYYAFKTRAPSARSVTDEQMKPEILAPAPNRPWVADLTYVKTHSGMVYVAFIIDVYGRMIVGWQASRSLKADLALHALEQAIWSRKHQGLDQLVHHSDRGVQYLSIRYTERLAEAGGVGSVGSKGDSYDNAMAESVIGLYKTELIRNKGPWKQIDDVEFATLEWVDWWNHRRLLEPIGMIPPAEAEDGYCSQQVSTEVVETQTVESL